MIDFTESQLERYSRNIIVREIGGKGQSALLKAKILVIGAGGLGSPLLMYLAAAGIGTIGIVDDDVVELSNLQRQIIHATPSIGMPKIDSARDRLGQLNPDCSIITYNNNLTLENASNIMKNYDIIADGCDNATTRFVVNDIAYQLKKPLVSAAIRGFEGQLYCFKPYLEGDYPCYRCLYSENVKETDATCSRSGVLGSIAGVMGSLQATEIIKEILEVGESIAQSMIIYQSLTSNFRNVTLHRDPKCPTCS